MEFVDRTPVTRFLASIGVDTEFTEAHVTSINAGTIVALQVIISLVTKKLNPLPSMMVGIVIGSIGFFILAFSSNAWLFVLGIVVFSIGEMTCHPKYYSFVGQVAPAENKAVYMGYAFSLRRHWLAHRLHRGRRTVRAFSDSLQGAPNAAVEQVRSFWMAFGFLGLLAMLGLLAYTRIFSQDSAHTRSWPQGHVRGVYALCSAGRGVSCLAAASGVWSPKPSCKVASDCHRRDGQCSKPQKQACRGN
jgi:dipeptide/tripeptide permease